MYAYDALPADGFIRLFMLESGTGEQPLRGSLFTYKLDEAPCFEAISYVWGSSDRYIELICDGQQILITPSLSDVLHRVRLLDRAQDEGHGKPLLELLNYIDQNLFTNLTQEWNSAPYIYKDHPLANDSRWESLRYLLETPWFWRGWVVQEAAHARDGVVLWGDHEFSWTVIMRTLIWAFRHASQTIWHKMNFQMSDMYWSCFSVSRKGEVQPFMPEAFWRNTGKVLNNFHSARDHHLADPRDRISAFYDLPASDKSAKLQIVPNYHRTFTEVCKGFALKYMDVYGDLDLLIYVIHDEESLKRDFLSWIPLWSARNGFYEGFRSEDFRSYYADVAPLIERHGPRLPFRCESNALQVSGLRFAKVRMVSAVLSKKQLTSEGIARLWSEVYSVHQPNITTDSDRFSMFTAALFLGLKAADFNYQQEIQGKAAFTLKIFNIATGQAKLSINCAPREGQASGVGAQQVLRQLQDTATDKRLVVTDRGYGLAAVVTREGDECVILGGGKMPFVLRKADGASNYRLVGPIYHSSEYGYDDVDSG
ncbi:hypothetical protein LA080_011617 [Diaporthe eres]|nr:hypothetical protein LA080_011617 [Diaporthe eres]